jgi:copper chaperone NosL
MTPRLASRALRLLALLLPLAAACAPAPEPIVVGRDSCDHCHMAVADARFAAELVTRHGRVYRFDSVECLATHYLREAEREDVHSIWVTDLNDPARLLRVEEASFVRSASLRTPMGAGLAAFEATTGRARALAIAPGEVLTWPQVLAGVESGVTAAAPGHAEPREVADAYPR